jgi:hypothetical protein
MGGSFDAVEGAGDDDGIEIGLCCQHGFSLSDAGGILWSNVYASGGGLLWITW